MNDKFRIIQGDKSRLEKTGKSSVELSSVNPDGSVESHETEPRLVSYHPAGRLGREAIKKTIERIESIPGYSGEEKRPNLEVIQPLITEIPEFD